MRNVLLAMVMTLAMSGTAAVYAMSEWWAPNGKSCPTFDSEDACKAYCRQDQSRCGGEVQCSWKTGDQRPSC